MFRADEKANPRAAQDDGVRAPCTSARHHVDNFLARQIRNGAAAQLIEDDIVDPAPLALSRYDR